MRKAIDSHKIRLFQELAMIVSSHPWNAQESKLVYWGSLCDLITTPNAIASFKRSANYCSISPIESKATGNEYDLTI